MESVTVNLNFILKAVFASQVKAIAILIQPKVSYLAAPVNG